MADQKGISDRILGVVSGFPYSCRAVTDGAPCPDGVVCAFLLTPTAAWTNDPFIPQPCHRVFDHLSEIATNPNVKVLTFNHEGIFNQDDTDIEALKGFIQQSGNLRYPILVDANRVAINGMSHLHSKLYSDRG